MPDSTTVTDLLRAWSGKGDPGGAGDALLRRVYEPLRGLARRQLRRRPRRPTLQTTELAHEAYLRLGCQRQHWNNSAHFFGVATLMMQRTLADRGRRAEAAKRGGDVVCVALDESRESSPQVPAEMVSLREALSGLRRRDPFKATIVELRFFGGLSESEVARALGCSRDTVTRHWRSARAWLARELA